MRLGIDISNYQAEFSREGAQTARLNDASFVIIGRQRNNRIYEAAQAGAALDAGMRIVGEYWISLGGAWPTPLPESKFIAIDVEPGSEFYTEADIDNALAQVATTGLIPVIYSSKWAWDALGLTGVTKYGEQGIALWSANYDGRADGFVLPRPFGGWTECAIDQFTDKGSFGLSYPVDANAISDEFWARCYPDEPQVLALNTNIVNGEWDIGATRIPLLGIIETAAREFRRNAGAKADALAAVERGFE